MVRFSIPRIDSTLFNDALQITTTLLVADLLLSSTAERRSSNAMHLEPPMQRLMITIRHSRVAEQWEWNIFIDGREVVDCWMRFKAVGGGQRA